VSSTADLKVAQEEVRHAYSMTAAFCSQPAGRPPCSVR
jgi:hypothetical protein